MIQSSSVKPSSDAVLATSLATKLWPHREHESNAVKNLFCCAGLHRWRQLELKKLVPIKKFIFVFGVLKVRIDGVIYEP